MYWWREGVVERAKREGEEWREQGREGERSRKSKRGREECPHKPGLQLVATSVADPTAADYCCQQQEELPRISERGEGKCNGEGGSTASEDKG